MLLPFRMHRVMFAQFVFHSIVFTTSHTSTPSIQMTRTAKQSGNYSKSNNFDLDVVIMTIKTCHGQPISCENELWTFRSQDFSFPGTNVPHGNFRSVELSFRGTFVPRNFRSLGTFVPVELSFPWNFRSLGTFVPRCNRTQASRSRRV